MGLSYLAMLAALAIGAYGAGWFRAYAAAVRGIPLNSYPHDHGLLAALLSVTMALLAYAGLMLLTPAIAAWFALSLGVVAAAWLLVHISPDFRARKLFDYLVGWLLMAASAATIIFAVGIGLSAVTENLRYHH